jgi:TatD DNase family protein
MHQIPYTDAHTHHRYAEGDIRFIRNGFLHPNAGKLGYPVCVGLHPWLINADFEAQLNTLQRLISQPHIVAIGECGLDYSRAIPRSVQQQVFAVQLALAQEHRKTVVVHLVKAMHDLPALLKNHDVDIVIHGFDGNMQQIGQLLDYRIWFSLGPHLLNQPKKFKQLLTSLPLDRILFETDIYRMDIRRLYAAAANYLNQKEIDLTQTVFTTFTQLFFPHVN